MRNFKLLLKVLESCVPVTRLTLAIRKSYWRQTIKCLCLVPASTLRIAKVNLVTGTQDSST